MLNGYSELSTCSLGCPLSLYFMHYAFTFILYCILGRVAVAGHVARPSHMHISNSKTPNSVSTDRNTVRGSKIVVHRSQIS